MFSLPCSLFQLLMEVETLLLIPTTPHLRIWTAKLYPLTLFFFFLSSRLSSPWGAAVVSLPGLPAETLDQLHPPPPHCRTLTLLHTLCQHLYAIYIIATTDMFLCSYSPYPCNPMRTLYTH